MPDSEQNVDRDGYRECDLPTGQAQQTMIVAMQFGSAHCLVYNKQSILIHVPEIKNLFGSYQAVEVFPPAI